MDFEKGLEAVTSFLAHFMCCIVAMRIQVKILNILGGVRVLGVE